MHAIVMAGEQMKSARRIRRYHKAVVGRFCETPSSQSSVQYARSCSPVHGINKSSGLFARLLDVLASLAAQHHVRFGFGAVAGPSCGPLPIDPEIIISEQVRLGTSVAWLGRSYGRACEKLTLAQLENEIRWIRNQFDHPDDAERNFRLLQQQVGSCKNVLAVAS